MGHVRLGTLSTSRKWRDVVELLEEGAPVERIAGAAADAADRALSGASRDPAFQQAAWLLLNLPLSARQPDFIESLRALGMPVNGSPSLFELSAAIAAGLDGHSREIGGRTDLGEMAQQALVESLVGAIEPQLPTLFGAEPEDVRSALGRLSSGNRFASLARDFFARLTIRTLDYFLSRELANHIGADGRFASDTERRAFDRALSLHAQEASKIVEAFAGDWYGKTVWRDGGLDREAVDRFTAFAFKKLRSELGRRRDDA